MTPRLRAVLVWAFLLGVTGCWGLPEEIHEQARANRLTRRGVVVFDSTGAYTLAGMSAVKRVDVDPLRMKDLNGDTLGPGFLTYHARCTSCHETPDPGMYTISVWRGTLRQMGKRQLEAGLMPITEDDRSVMLEFLRRHAKPVR